MAELSLDAFYKLVELNGDKCFRVQDMNGYKITEILGTSPLNALDQFRQMSDLLSAYVKLRIFGAKTMPQTQERQAHTYLIRFETTGAAAGAVAGPPMVNGVGFSEVLAIMKENNKTVGDLQKEIAKTQMDAIQKEIAELKSGKNKDKKSEMQEFIAGIKDLLPVAKEMGWFGMKPATPAIGNNGAAAPATKITMEGMDGKSNDELGKLATEKFNIFQGKTDVKTALLLFTLGIDDPEIIRKFVQMMRSIDAASGKQLFDLVVKEPVKFMKFVEVLTRKPELMDTLYSLAQNQ
jgi:hypothetical protein